MTRMLYIIYMYCFRAKYQCHLKNCNESKINIRHNIHRKYIILLVESLNVIIVPGMFDIVLMLRVK